MNFDNVDIHEYGHLGLVAGFIKKIGLIEYIDHIIPKTKPCHVSHGEAVAAMILNALGFHSQALYLVPEYFHDKPIDLLIAPGIQSEHLNDDVLGRTLDAIYEYGVSSLYSELAIKTLHVLKITPKAINLDLTSFHVDGTAYNKNTPEDDDKLIRIVQGYSRDHRPELNQAILALITENQAGIPLYLEALSGNTEDKSAFKEIIDSQLKSLEAADSCQYLIADSALYTKATIQSLHQQNRYFITRVSATSKEAKTVINSPDLTAFQTICDGYEGYYLDREYAGVPQKWLVIRSKAGRVRALKTFDKEVAKGVAREQKQLASLMRKTFACEVDAKARLAEFSKSLNYTEITSVKINATAQYSGRGAPKKGDSPVGYKYSIEATSGLSEKRLEEAKLKLGIFVLSTNNIKNTPNMNELLSLYKSQQRVERGFRFLKDPAFMTSSFYLEKPSRIEALLFLMTTALMVYAGLEHQIRTVLKKNNATIKNSVKKQTDNPTLKWIFFKFMRVKCLVVDKTTVYIKGLEDDHRLIIYLLGEPYGSIYRVVKK